MQPDYKSEKESRIRTDDTPKDEPVEPDEQVKFANHIKQLLKQTFSDDQNRMIMTIEELGDKVGIKRGVFAKIVNQSRPNKHVASRDCIPETDEPMLLAIWRDGHVDSSSECHVIDCMAEF